MTGVTGSAPPGRGPTATVEEALAAFREGKPVILVDDLAPEGDASLVAPAEDLTATLCSFLIRHTSGLLCAVTTGERLNALSIPLMGNEDTTTRPPAFAVAVDAREGITTGISARDRARTIRLLAARETRAEDLVRPGHVLPMRCSDGGVLKCAARPEAAVDLATLAGRTPAAVIAALVDDEDGSVARLPRARDFAARYSLPLLSVADLVAWRLRRDTLVKRTGTWSMPTTHGAFTAHTFTSLLDGDEHLALVRGSITHGDVLVRVHAECVAGDTLGSTQCDCASHLHSSLRMIADEGHGVLVYLRGRESRRPSHGRRAYRLRRLDPYEPPPIVPPTGSHAYGVGAQILRDLGVQRIRLLTDNPSLYLGLTGYGVEIVGRQPVTAPNNAASALPHAQSRGTDQCPK